MKALNISEELKSLNPSRSNSGNVKSFIIRSYPKKSIAPNISVHNSKPCETILFEPSFYHFQGLREISQAVELHIRTKDCVIGSNKWGIFIPFSILNKDHPLSYN